MTPQTSANSPACRHCSAFRTSIARSRSTQVKAIIFLKLYVGPDTGFDPNPSDPSNNILHIPSLLGTFLDRQGTESVLVTLHARPCRHRQPRQLLLPRTISIIPIIRTFSRRSTTINRTDSTIHSTKVDTLTTTTPPRTSEEQPPPILDKVNKMFL